MSHRFCGLCALMLAVFSIAASSQGEESLPAGVKNTQAAGEAPPTPQESLKKFTLPDGFQISLFAGEPDVQQPIGMAFDDRGRLWVAECYSYTDWQDKQPGPDRILIFTDTNGDGQFDERKVFWEGAYNLSGLELGFGGVWALCAPHLLFIPDADGDDKPDGEPVVKLEGWTLKARHNIVNGLAWGPDGWLYGCHGILDESRVGVPGSPVGKRPPINCGVWRYHPISQRYETVCHGTTNPWGLDFDEYGEAWFVNCVIGHLWQMIPGAHYKRMFGKDYIAHSYQLIDSHSDHLHWGGGDWRLSRGGEGIHNAPGGGHAHCGLMVYLADNWPAEYRGRVYMNNIHGGRVNCDILRREGSGYVAEHGDDLIFAHDPWFRGVVIKYGPDGGVYIADWTDLGECHDNDGVHRSSGRIYKVSYGQPKQPAADLDVSKASDEQLLAWQKHPNQWYVRKARRVLQERANADRDMTAVHAALNQDFASGKSSPERLNALWTLYVTGGLDEARLLKLLEDQDEYVRGWSVRLLSDGTTISAAALAAFEKLATSDPAPQVRLKLASTLQRLPIAERWTLTGGLLAHAEDVEDHNLPLLIWYGIEPSVASDKAKAIKLLSQTKIPLVRQFIAKRLAEAAP